MKQDKVNSAKKSRSEQILWDDEIRGLGLRTRGKARRWIYQTRVNGKIKKVTLGEACLDISQARRLALAHREALEGTSSQDQKDYTLTDLWQVYWQYVKARLKPKTVISYEGLAKSHILPSLGRIKLTALDRAQVAQWYHALSDHPATANKAMAVLAGMMSHAELLGLRS